MTKLKVIIGSTMEDAGERFIKAWERAEAGEAAEPEYILGFADMETFLRVLSPARYELLRKVRHDYPEGASIYAIAKALGRDYKNVHGDIKTLLEEHLIEKNDSKYFVPFDSIQSELRLA